MKLVKYWTAWVYSVCQALFSAVEDECNTAADFTEHSLMLLVSFSKNIKTNFFWKLLQWFKVNLCNRPFLLYAYLVLCSQVYKELVRDNAYLDSYRFLSLLKVFMCVLCQGASDPLQLNYRQLWSVWYGCWVLCKNNIFETAELSLGQDSWV